MTVMTSLIRLRHRDRVFAALLGFGLAITVLLVFESRDLVNPHDFNPMAKVPHGIIQPKFQQRALQRSSNINR
jgi:hypothetical protein